MSFIENFLQSRDINYGWVMVFVVFVLSGLAFGSLASISVFLKPVSLEFGWSRGQTSFAYTLASFASAAFGVMWGQLADKYGTKWFGTIGAICMSLTLVSLSSLDSIIQFYILYFLFGAFGCALLFSPLYANVGFWFRENPGLALGIAASGGAIGQAFIPHISGVLIESGGWEDAYIKLAIIYIIIAFPVSLLIKESPWRITARTEDESESRDFPLSEKEVVAWISFAVIFCCVCMSVPIMHLVPLLTDAGFTLEFATSVLMVLMICGAFGRIFGGILGDRIGALPGYILMSLGQTVFVVWFPHLSSPTGIYLLAAFFGFTYSGVMSSILVCTRMMVSAKYGARAMSLTSFFGWIGMGLGGFLGGYFFDVYGDYSWAFTFAGIMGLINLVILSQFWLRIRNAKKGLEGLES
ncbi:MFS transporter [Gammaproteobacteria bacterium]|nr:MFS transporter [Gammaproteobacteria bacterium]MDB4816183.1 MFS transporter [Gammaproteobacteria bacterium]MDC0508852.1 MFS transporter [Gammaproteobacteria bacterium]MDC0546313.1 MFS transporter [Gammaproteobacteria bacterium]